MFGFFFNSYMYREIKDAPRKDVWMAEISTGIMWWWVFWHMWHDWGHIVVSIIINNIKLRTNKILSSFICFK